MNSRAIACASPLSSAAYAFAFLETRSVDALDNVSWKIKRVWLALCVSAGLAEQVGELEGKGGATKKGSGAVTAWKATVRIHDLRHPNASILASSDVSVPIIGMLLERTQIATTARYAHLLDDPLRAATERVEAIVTKVSEDD